MKITIESNEFELDKVDYRKVGREILEMLAKDGRFAFGIDNGLAVYYGNDVVRLAFRYERCIGDEPTTGFLQVVCEINDVAGVPICMQIADIAFEALYNELSKVEEKGKEKDEGSG